MTGKLHELLENKKSIHIVTHLNPDYDAYASLLFTAALLKKNYPEKSITTSLETEELNNVVSFLPGFNEIMNKPLLSVLQENDPEAIIFVDSPSVYRVTKDTQKVKELLNGKVTVIFDHHEIEETDVDLLVNVDRYAAVEVIYSYGVANGFTLPEKWEEYYLTGFIGDSYRFYYQVPTYRDSFETISTILDHGYTIREYSDRLYGYTLNDLLIQKLMHSHLSSDGNLLYATMSYEEFKENIEGKLTTAEYKKARRFFIDELMVRTYGIDLAFFIVPDDTVNDGQTYTGSIRSRMNTYDCTKIAKYLNGGGHITGAGFNVKAETLEDALHQVLGVIAAHKEEARL